MIVLAQTEFWVHFLGITGLSGLCIDVLITMFGYVLLLESSILFGGVTNGLYIIIYSGFIDLLYDVVI